MRATYLAGVALLFVAGCGSTAKNTNTTTVGNTISGQLFYVQSKLLGPDGSPCGVPSSDIAPRTQVTVSDQSGVTIGVASLGGGSSQSKYACVFPFTLSVPNEPFYGVAITTHGKVTISFTDLVSKKWNVSVTLSDLQGGSQLALGTGGA